MCLRSATRSHYVADDWQELDSREHSQEQAICLVARGSECDTSTETTCSLFSHMNLVNSYLRNLLGNQNLQACVRFAVQSLFDADTFPFEKALAVWKADKPHRERESKRWEGQKRKRSGGKTGPRKSAKASG